MMAMSLEHIFNALPKAAGRITVSVEHARECLSIASRHFEEQAELRAADVAQAKKIAEIELSEIYREVEAERRVSFWGRRKPKYEVGSEEFKRAVADRFSDSKPGRALRLAESKYRDAERSLNVAVNNRDYLPETGSYSYDILSEVGSLIRKGESLKATRNNLSDVLRGAV